MILVLMQALVFFFRLLVLVFILIYVSGCGLGYLLQSADGQYKLISKKVSFEKVLNNPQTDAETKRKIQLVQETKKFAESEISLAPSKNYEAFVQLEDPFVTYAVTASPQNKIQAYLWSFPVVGKVPYKGYFKKKDAEAEALEMKKQNFDVLVRGVSAYSTLGWFNDPLLSSMLTDEDAGLVETIIHEMTHTTLYIKNNAEFNERLATYVGQRAMESFYSKKEGTHSKSLERARLIRADADIFFSFISKEIKNMDQFYEQNKSDFLNLREKEFEKIKTKFKNEVTPKLKTQKFEFFSRLSLNNAILMNYKIYYNNLEIFERLYKASHNNWKDFFGVLKTLKDSADAESDLNNYLLKAELAHK